MNTYSKMTLKCSWIFSNKSNEAVKCLTLWSKQCVFHSVFKEAFPYLNCKHTLFTAIIPWMDRSEIWVIECILLGFIQPQRMSCSCFLTIFFLSHFPVLVSWEAKPFICVSVSMKYKEVWLIILGAGTIVAAIN